MKTTSISKYFVSVMILLAAPAAFAGDFDDMSGGSGTIDTGGGGGGGFSFGSSTNTDSGPSIFTSSNSSNNVFGGGGNIFGESNNSAANTAAAISVISDLFSSRSSGESTSAVSDSYAPTVSGSSWSQSLFSETLNPVVSAFMGSSSNQIADSHPIQSQSFAALLVSKSPVAMFLDLNGDGVRGGFVDGLLYNLYFGHLTEADGRYDSINQNNGTISRFTHANNQSANREGIRNEIKNSHIAFAKELSDGRKYARLNEIIEMAHGDVKTLSKADQDIALATLGTLAVLHPALTSEEGPLLSQSNQHIKSRAQSLRAELFHTFQKVQNREMIQGGSRLALNTTITRLAYVLALTETHLRDNPGIELGEDVLNTMRASLYMIAFEMKRMKVSQDTSHLIFQEIITSLSLNAPQSIRVAAENASSKEALNKLTQLLDSTPVIHEKMGMSGKARWTVNTLAASATLLAWWFGGEMAVDVMTKDIAMQVIGLNAGYVALPGTVAIMSNFIFKKTPKSVHGGDVKNGYSALCEKLLAR